MIKDFFFQATKSYSVQEFEYNMNELNNINARIKPYLHNIRYHKWAKAFSINNKYSIITSNIIESMNTVNIAAN
jgi:hypothetical protein